MGEDSPSTIPVMVPWIGVEEQEAAAEAIASGWVAQGPRVAAFESAFAERVGARRAVAVSSATTGLHLALHLEGVGPGDEVICPSLSFIATANVIRYVGATVVFADVDPDTQNITVDTIEAVRTPATRAIIAVHQAGMPVELDSLRAYAAEHGLAIIEDAACAIGATHRSTPIGAGCRYGVFSFHPRKILTTGEGGMLVTDDDATADRAISLREHGTTMSAAARHSSGKVKLESYAEVGFNYRMTDIQAAVGLVQLGRLDEVIERRRSLADRYRDALAPHGILVADDPEWGTTNHQSLWVRFPEHTSATREDILEALAADGISARRGIMAAHLEPAYADTPHGPLPVTEDLTNNTLILPLHHHLSSDDQARVIESLVRATGVAGVAA